MWEISIGTFDSEMGCQEWRKKNIWDRLRTLSKKNGDPWLPAGKVAEIVGVSDKDGAKSKSWVVDIGSFGTEADAKRWAKQYLLVNSEGLFEGKSVAIQTAARKKNAIFTPLEEDELLTDRISGCSSWSGG